jgi:hypothetical protein
MQAIITKFLCPTNFRGSRYQAKCEAMTVTVAADHALNAEENHLAVCAELCRRMDARNLAKYGSKAAQWTKPKASGQIPSGEYVHVFLPVEVLA